MAAYAALASLLNTIDQIMSHPRLSATLDNNQIQPLHEKAAFLLDFIEGCHYGGGMISIEVEDLEARIASAAHAAEDVIESHIVDQIHAVDLAPSADDGATSSNSSVLLRLKNMKKNKKVRDLKRIIACAAHADEESLIVDQIHAGSNQAGFSRSLHLQQIIQDMGAILKKGAKVKEKLALKEEPPTHSRPVMETGESGMVGFYDELIQLLDELTNQQSSRRIISIVGMGGTGKTTLAQNVYHNLLIKQHFDIRAWATISQQYNVQEILSQLLSDQEKSSELGEQLHKTLSGRRFLIILDDVWSVEACDEVRRFIHNNGNGSRVVVTTRLSNVARDCQSSSCFAMKPLDEHKSWKLFCKKAFHQESCPYPQLERVGKEIANLCRGLPLSTVVRGGLLLNSPRSLQFWENVFRNMKSNPNAKEKEESLDILFLSYNHLPPHLKPCFLYMGVFEEDSEIRVSKIIKLWIAEGFVRPKNTQILEVVAEGYLKELIDRNLILVSRRRHNGKIGSCGIHDLLRDLCSKVAEQEEFFHVPDGRIRGTERRLIGSKWMGSLLGGPSLARSMLARNTLEQPVNHKLLRVWDAGLIKSPLEIYGNVNLCYSAYKPMFGIWSVRKLSTSVFFIWNLQTLIMTSNAGAVAPIEIWKM